MGAVGLNGGTSGAANPAERLKLSSAGWARCGCQASALLLR